MKISLIILTITASLMLAVSTQAAQHQHHDKSTSIKDCENAESKQHCAKTMTSTFDSKGRLWSVWTNSQHLYVNHSDDNGKSFSQPVKVNKISEDISARNEHRPKIKASDSGIIYLSWTIKLKKRFTGHIRFSKSTDNGTSFSQPVTINDNLDIIGHRFDALSVNKKGHIYISWLDKRDQQLAIKAGKKYNGAAAYYAVSTDDGASFSKNKKIADNSCECCRMAMDIDNNDLPVIAWRHIYGDNIRDHSIVSFSKTNTPLKPNRLSHDLWKIKGCPHHGPSISINQNNRYHTVWFNNAIKRHGIFYAHSDDQGKSFSNPVSIGDYEKRASHADVKATNNTVYIVWKEFHAPYSKIFIMISEDQGISWNKKRLIAKTTKTTDYPFLISHNNNVLVSWHIPGNKYKLIPINKKKNY
ncbi:MAG: exo-alpha-sialidase [Gammaproteobacteria bacterium]|nr:exo-alpha-sialidase [Gammaproteobacteria bacterium]